MYFKVHCQALKQKTSSLLNCQYKCELRHINFHCNEFLQRIFDLREFALLWCLRVQKYLHIIYNSDNKNI